MQRLLSAIVLGLLAGCAGAAEREGARLSLACQLSKCDCVSNSFTVFDSEPVQWQPDGSASCRDGYHLRRLEAPPAKPI